MPKVLISDELSPAVIEIFKNRGVEVDYKPGLKKEELIAIIGEYDGLAVRSASAVPAFPVILNMVSSSVVFILEKPWRESPLTRRMVSITTGPVNASRSKEHETSLPPAPVAAEKRR